MKYDGEYDDITDSHDPLRLYTLIERTVLSQTDDRNRVTLYRDAGMAVHNFEQNLLSKSQYYERFNTKVDVAIALGMSFCPTPMLQEEIMRDTKFNRAGGLVPKFKDLTDEEQASVIEQAQERYLTQLFIAHSGKQHAHLRRSLADDYTKGHDNYPDTRQDALRMLDTFSKNAVTPPTPSQGTAFAQKAGASDKKEGDKKKRVEFRKCFNCGKKVI
jgi:hypothetical protein